MKDNGKIKKEMVEDLNYGRMAQYIKAIGRTILLMAMAVLSMLMAMYMLDNGLKTEPLEKVIYLII